jgi:uncharacterized spore protein YtfJ
MTVDELISKTKDSLEARMVYAEPVQQDGVTVIAAASVAGGGGGGTGRDQRGQQGEGGGFGLTAKPTGAFVVKDGKVRWHPAVDVNRVIATIGSITIAALLVAARITKIRARSGNRCTGNDGTR